MSGIIFIGICIVAFIIYRIILMFSVKHKLSNFVRYCNLYGYSFWGYYEKIGLEYRKEISINEITNLFKDWNINPIAFPKDSRIVEHLVAVDFPFYEINYSPVIENHGGIRLFHFFSVFVKVEDGYEHLPYEKRYIGDFKGKYFNHINYMTGKAIDSSIKWSTKDALLELVNDAKYWNGGEKVINKYKDLIELFTSVHKEFSIYDEAPNKVELKDWKDNNYVTIILSQEYEKNNIDKKIVVTMLKKDSSGYFQIDQSFKGNEDQSVIFYSFNNECIKEKIKRDNHYTDDFMEGIKLPTTRLLTQAEMIDAMWEYSVSNMYSDIPNINPKNKPSLVPLGEFERAHGTLEVGCVVNDNTGDCFDICLCMNKDTRVFIGFSSYQRKLSYNKVTKMKDKLYIRCDGNGCYFLCTKESEERCRTDTDEESQMCHYIEYDAILSVLKELNIEGKAKDYTFTNEKDF